MPAATAPELPAAPSPAGLVETLLNASLAGTMLLRPVYAAGGPDIVDFEWERLNPAAQRQLSLPARPAESFLTLFPMARAAGVFGFYRDTFLSGQLAHRQTLYQHEWLDGYYLLAAQRCGEELVVSFINASERPRPAEEEALAAAETKRQTKQREELFQVFEQAPVIVALLRGREHFFYYRNPAFQALFPGRAMVGRLYADAMPEIVAAGHVRELDQVYATGRPHHGNALPLVTAPPGGGAPHERYYDFSYNPYREDGRTVGLAIFAHDVTEQVLARREREARRQELQRIFEQAPVAITVLRGPEYTIELANPAICAIWGRQPGEVLGQPYFEAVPETAGQGFEELFADVLRTGEPVFITETPITLARAHTDRPPLGYFNFVFQSLLDEQWQPGGIVAIGIEVTDQVWTREQVQGLYEELASINEELRATNEELHESNRRLSRTNADLDTFVYSASHDLKSPITNIEGLLLALRQQLPPAALEAELVPRLLGMMDGAVRRFQQTLGHLTDVSRLQQALFDQPAETVDLPALVEAVRLDILPELTAAGAALTLDLATCPTLHFSAKNLRSILYNLLSNAVKYRDPARPARISLGCYPAAPGQVTLVVRDNGLGLTEAQQGELFQLFRRLHDHVPGSGVGLYMVKKMVDNMGGTLAVESKPGVGSTFSVTLPVVTEPGA